MTARKESWLARWSRRKLADRAGGEHAQEPGAAPEGVCAASSKEARAETPADAAKLGENEADLVALDAQSDYTPFLRQGVRAEVRSAALRKLWSSEPLFSQVDGLQDYAGDFTDSATVPSEPLATAFQIGWGIAGQAPDQEGARKPAEPEQAGSRPSEADQKPAGSAEHPQRTGPPDPGRGQA